LTAEGDALHVLRTTRSVRRRLDFERPVEPEVLEECIDVAVQAPTGLNREAWRFLVITEAEAKQRVATLYRSAFDAVSREWAALLPEGASEESPLASRPTYRALADRLHELPALILVCTLGRPPANNLALQVGFYGSVLPAAWSLMVALRARGIGVHVHYIPLHLQPYYQEKFGHRRGNFPESEAYYDAALTIPLFPAMRDSDCERVVEAVLACVR
jgi:dTDP-4-amino-4,6-dideoxygalactose transaminase